jgi:hypothetical protein
MEVIVLTAPLQCSKKRCTVKKKKKEVMPSILSMIRNRGGIISIEGKRRGILPGKIVVIDKREGCHRRGRHRRQRHQNLLS